jgi:hypothetical protein
MTNEGTGKLKYIIRELHNILWQMWDVWNDVAIANHLVVVHRQPNGQRRRNMRLLVGIVRAGKE